MWVADRVRRQTRTRTARERTATLTASCGARLTTMPSPGSDRVLLAWRLATLGVVLRRVDPDVPFVAATRRRAHAIRCWHDVFGGRLAVATPPLTSAEIAEAGELVRLAWRAEDDAR